MGTLGVRLFRDGRPEHPYPLLKDSRGIGRSSLLGASFLAGFYVQSLRLVVRRTTVFHVWNFRRFAPTFG